MVQLNLLVWLPFDAKATWFILTRITKLLFNYKSFVVPNVQMDTFKHSSNSCSRGTHSFTRIANSVSNLLI